MDQRCNSQADFADYEGEWIEDLSYQESSSGTDYSTFISCLLPNYVFPFQLPRTKQKRLNSS